MSLDFNLCLFPVELGTVFLALACLVLDIVIQNKPDRGSILATVGMAGVSALFLLQISQWGVFASTLNGTFSQDGLAFFFKLIFFLAAFLTLFMARAYQSELKRGHGEFSLLILFALTGMVFLASTNDFLLFFIALETLTVSLYIMTAYLRDKSRSIEAGVKYLVLGALSTAIFLYGLSFVYGSTGSTSYFVIRDRLLAMQGLPNSFLFGMVLIIASLGFKIAAVPFHLWAPDIYEGAPTPVTAYLAIGSKAAGFAALMRLLVTVFAPAHGYLVLLLASLSAMSLFYGNLGAIPQTNIKRLLGYSSIGHAGYLLIGLAAFPYSGGQAVLFYLVSYLFSTGGAFLVLIAITRYLKTNDIDELAGLSQKSPLLAAGMLVSLLSLAGLPPLAGFFAKFYLLWSAVHAHLLWLAVIGVINVLTSLFYYLKIVKVMYVDKPKDAVVYQISASEKCMQYVCMLSVIFIGVYQGPLVKLAEMAILNLIK